MIKFEITNKLVNSLPYNNIVSLSIHFFTQANKKKKICENFQTNLLNSFVCFDTEIIVSSMPIQYAMVIEESSNIT